MWHHQVGGGRPVGGGINPRSYVGDLVPMLSLSSYQKDQPPPKKNDFFVYETSEPIRI